MFSNHNQIQLTLNAHNLRSIHTIQNSFEKTECQKHTNKHKNNVRQTQKQKKQLKTDDK